MRNGIAGGAESAGGQAASASGQRHRVARGAGRAADRAHQQPRRALQDPRQGLPFAARAPQAGEPAAQAARLSQAQGRGQVSRPDRAPQPAQVGLPMPREPARIECGERFCSRPDKGSPLNPTKQTFPYGSHQVTLETGEIARQAHGAVVCTMEDTVVLATVVAAKEPRTGQDWFPLTVDYVEKTYAAGKIPGGFFKREGRPSEKETLTSRLIDRPIRPLFPDGFFNEVQVVATVLSLNPEVDSDIPAMLAVSAALTLSGIPFNGPIGACRIGYVNGQYVVNPTMSQLKESQLNLVVAGTEQGVLMVESEALELPEDVMLGAVGFGHEQMQAAIQAIHELAEEAGKPAWEWQPPAKNEALIARVSELAEQDFRAAFAMKQKQARNNR